MTKEGSFADIAPFIATGGLLLLTPLLSRILRHQIEAFYRDTERKFEVTVNNFYRKADAKSDKKLGLEGSDDALRLEDEFHPDRIATFVLYQLDAYQVFAATLLPTVGVAAVLASHQYVFSSWQLLVLLAAPLVGALLCLLMVAAGPHPVLYDRLSPVGITPVTYLGLLANGLSAWVVYTHPA
ncbi:hypothetical protein [Streptacidiphilus pinicola]|uniref:hypothetical protein n=1 Tax=Streptacidiphilus pinicola TaxID=2219663 RepID=UPI00105832DB|nr:hypothetical protein [Streptacidiphilus pinicola]